MASTIPDELFVTYQKLGDGRLGFASPYTKDAAFRKRRGTQLAWAYGHHSYDEDSGIVSRREAFWNKETNRQEYRELVVVAKDLQPAVLKNELLEGFKIADTVRRSGWNGGNVVWRILDPRGFELEISSSNFARIVDCAVIDKGVIQDRCVWGRDGANNILLPESSDIYQEAAAKTKLNKTVVSMREVKVGDIVEINANSIKPDELPAVYVGKVKQVVWQERFEWQNNGHFGRSDSGYKSGTFNVAAADNDKALDLFRTPKGYRLIKTFKISKIVGHSDIDVTAEIIAANKDIADDPSEVICYQRMWSGPQVCGVYPAGTNLTLDLVEATDIKVPNDFTSWPLVRKYYPKFVLIQFPDGTWRTTRRNTDSMPSLVNITNVQRTDTSVHCDFEIGDNNALKAAGFTIKSGQRYDLIFTRRIDPTGAKAYRIVGKANGVYIGEISRST